MKKFTLQFFLAAFILLSGISFAQLPMIRTTFNTAFVPITSGSGGGTLSTAVGDDVTQADLPIGFNFVYLANTYTSMGVSTNGWASFVTGALSSAQNGNGNLFTTTGPNISIGPWWDDLASDSIVYITTGVPGSQVFTIQWNSKSYFSGSTQLIRFQLKLFETTNVIEFHYGNVIPGTPSNSESASIGIEGLTGGNGNYLDAVTGSAFVGHGFLNTTTKWPTRFYRFTPGTPTPISGGTYNVGIAQTYPTIDEAVAEINHRGISGPVTLALTQSLYDLTPTNGDNIFPVFVGPVAGLSSANSLVIQPASGTSTLAYDGALSGFGANAASTAAFGTTNEPIIGLVGSNNVTVRNLFLTTSTGTVVDRGVSMINHSAALGTSSCTVSNCTVVLNRANTSSIGFETRVPTTPTVATGSNNNNIFSDVTVNNSYNGILFSGNATFPDLSQMLTTSSPTLFNTIGAAIPNDIGNGTSTSYGVQALNQRSVTVNNNIVRNITVNGAVLSDGIFINSAQGLSSVYNNKVMNIRNNSTTATTGITGIRANIATSAGNELRVYNNFVSGLTSAYTGAASATRQIKGIQVQSAGGGVSTSAINIDFNSVSIDGSASPNISSTAYEIGTTSGPVINTRNNIFANLTGNQTAPSANYAWVSTSAASIGNTGSASNYNDLFVQGTAQAFVGLGNATTYSTLANWQTAMVGQDANSQSCAPGFVNNTSDLHATSLCLESAGNSASISWVTTDIDNTARPVTPDIGADEFVPCSSVSGGAISPTSFSICVGQSLTLNSTGSTVGGGIIYEWQTSGSPTGPFNNVTVGSGSNTTSYNTGTLNVGTFYYIQKTTCVPSTLNANTNTITVFVNGLPTVAVSPITATICTPGGSSVNLTATGASTYSWGPASGLSSTTGSSVNALPPASVVYTVTGTSSVGCVGTATASISVNEAPSIFSISASPSTICANGNSTLQVASALTDSYVISSISYSPANTPTTGVNTLCNNGSAVTPLSSGTLDDGGWSNLPITFNFNFFGSTYNSFAVSTNGFIFLGSGNPNTFTGYSNAFPSAAAARPSIGANYSDLDFDGTTSNSKIEYFTIGTSPNKQLVVNWTGQFFNNTGTITTQAILYESSNIIEVHTFTSSGTNASVEGIQNATGTTAYVVTGRNNVTYAIATPDAYRWTPAGGPLSYSWTPSTFLSAPTSSNTDANSVTSSTNYSVAITATNGCVGSATIALTVDIPTVTIVGTSSMCVGNTATLTANGTDTYTWNTSSNAQTITDTPTTTTNYTVVGTNTVTGCNNSATTTVLVINNPTIVVSSPTAICSGQTASITASGANTYVWSNGPTAALNAVSPTLTTVYTVTGSANGCSGTNTVNLTVNALPSLTLTASANSVCVGSPTVALTGSPAGGNYSGANVSGSAFTPSTTGTFTASYSYTDATTTCSNTVNAVIIVDPCTGITSTTSESSFSAYPNPTSAAFTLAFNNGLDKQITVSDLTGKVVYSVNTNVSSLSINLSEFANGMYNVKVVSNNTVEVMKLVKH